MSIWGKILGGAAGFALGGPLGALVGAVAGHAVDKMAGDDEPSRDGRKSVAFTIAVIALGAKMAKADGVVTSDEVVAFKKVFRVPGDEIKNVARVFDQAKRDSAGFEPYARQVAGMFRDNPAVLEELLGCLTFIARADGVMHESEVKYLRKVADIFGLDEAAFERITELSAGETGYADPYKILGVRRDASDQEIKSAYRRLVREHHPDKLIAEGLPEEFIETANQRLAGINAAYERIEKERGLS